MVPCTLNKTLQYKPITNNGSKTLLTSTAHHKTLTPATDSPLITTYHSVKEQLCKPCVDYYAHSAWRYQSTISFDASQHLPFSKKHAPNDAIEATRNSAKQCLYKDKCTGYTYNHRHNNVPTIFLYNLYH